MGDDTEIEKRIKEILGQLAGSASLCWTETPKGVFDSTQATSFVQEATNRVMATIHGGRKNILAAQIVGHQEAMRPLLEEWSKLHNEESK